MDFTIGPKKQKGTDGLTGIVRCNISSGPKAQREKPRVGDAMKATEDAINAEQ